MQTQVTSPANVEIVDTLRQVPSECYQQLGPSIPLNMPTTILHRHIPQQHAVDNLLKFFNTQVLYTYNLPIHEIESAREYQHSRLKMFIFI